MEITGELDNDLAIIIHSAMILGFELDESEA
jgi:hypothetical protein